MVYDNAAIKLRGPDAPTNFAVPRTKIESLNESSGYDSCDEAHNLSPASVLRFRSSTDEAEYSHPSSDSASKNEGCAIDSVRSESASPAVKVENQSEECYLADNCPMDTHFLDGFFNFENDEQTLLFDGSIYSLDQKAAEEECVSLPDYSDNLASPPTAEECRMLPDYSDNLSMDPDFLDEFFNFESDNQTLLLDATKSSNFSDHGDDFPVGDALGFGDFKEELPLEEFDFGDLKYEFPGLFKDSFQDELPANNKLEDHVIDDFDGAVEEEEIDLGEFNSFLLVDGYCQEHILDMLADGVGGVIEVS